MVYLEKIGKVDAIITEDSDLLVFGCKKVFDSLHRLLLSLIMLEMPFV